MSEESGVVYDCDDQGCLGEQPAGEDVEIPEASAPTILDRLNDDCWRVVLDFVPVRDIIRSERVSKRWQGIVQHYLREVGICYVSIRDTFEYHDATVLKMKPKNRIVIKKCSERESNSAVQFIFKWGECVVYSHCPGSRYAFKTIARHCPNLKSISIEMQGFGTGDLSQELVKFVEKLERVAFMDYTGADNLDDTMDMSDDTIRNSVLAYRDVKVSTAFWRNFRPTNLKSLTIRGGFDFRYFLSSVECYPKLTELILQGELKNQHLLFEKMPKLERLYLMTGYTEERRIENIRESVCSGLGSLKQFLIWQTSIQGCWPELVLTGCKGLQILDVRSNEISSYLKDLCKAHGPTLTEVRIIDNYALHDDDLVALIRSCPKLKSLDIRACDQLSEAFLPEAASAVRGRPGALRLHLEGFSVDKYDKINQTQYPELLMDVEPPSELSFFYRDEFLRPRHYIWGMEDHRDYRDRSGRFV